jgi:cyclopropane-fatty-acyl-phospholipid synthase
MPVIEERRIWLTDLENWRLHYAKTLHAWYERFQARRAEIAAIFDERFCRMWEFYLLSCEGDFLYQGACVFQLQLARKVDTVPLTRDYLYASPPRPRAARRPKAVAAE